MTEAHKRKISEAHKKLGKLHWTKRPEVRKKMSDKQKGKPSWNKGLHGVNKQNSGSFKKGMTPWNKGKKLNKLTTELRKRLSNIHKLRREKSHLWKGGITKINTSIRNSLEYRLWREAVFKRDNYTCIWCGARSKKGKKVILNADHIKPFALYPELRFAIDNGRTLCKECHKKTDSYLNKYIK
jgi:hypothetical protein